MKITIEHNPLAAPQVGDLWEIPEASGRGMFRQIVLAVAEMRPRCVQVEYTCPNGSTFLAEYGPSQWKWSRRAWKFVGNVGSAVPEARGE